MRGATGGYPRAKGWTLRCLGQNSTSARNEHLPGCSLHSSKPLCHFGSFSLGPVASLRTALTTLPLPNVLRTSQVELHPCLCEQL